MVPENWTTSTTATESSAQILGLLREVERATKASRRPRQRPKAASGFPRGGPGRVGLREAQKLQDRPHPAQERQRQNSRVPQGAREAQRLHAKRNDLETPERLRVFGTSTRTSTTTPEAFKTGKHPRQVHFSEKIQTCKKMTAVRTGAAEGAGRRTGGSSSSSRQQHEERKCRRRIIHRLILNMFISLFLLVDEK